MSSVLNNGLVEAIIVPNAGGWLQFSFLGRDKWANFSGKISAWMARRAPSSGTQNAPSCGDKASGLAAIDLGCRPPAVFDGAPRSVRESPTRCLPQTICRWIGGLPYPHHFESSELDFDEPSHADYHSFFENAKLIRTNNPIGIWGHYPKCKTRGDRFMFLWFALCVCGGFNNSQRVSPCAISANQRFESHSPAIPSPAINGISTQISLVWVGTTIPMRI
jgi:hypothetical protein